LAWRHEFRGTETIAWTKEDDMAIRVDELQQDDLLARYLEASRKYAVQERPRTNGDLLLARYLRAMERHGVPEADYVEDDFRTCTHCGVHGRFAHDDGGWAVCSACGVTA
jgi:hypothetical protein